MEESPFVRSPKKENGDDSLLFFKTSPSLFSPVPRRRVHVILCQLFGCNQSSYYFKNTVLIGRSGLTVLFWFTSGCNHVTQNPCKWVSSNVILAHQQQPSPHHTTILFGDFGVLHFVLNSGFMCLESVHSFPSMHKCILRHRSRVCTPRCRWAIVRQNTPLMHDTEFIHMRNSNASSPIRRQLREPSTAQKS